MAQCSSRATNPEVVVLKRLPFLLAATCCLALCSVQTEAICLPITCGPPPPTLWVWPDVSPPCNDTLQACIDAAHPGDVVEIHTNGPIAESVSFSEPLTLRAGSSYAPGFLGNQTVSASTASSAADQTIVVQR